MTNAILRIIPIDKIADVKSALLATFNRSNVDNIQLLTGGLSSALVYKITIDHAHYVLRIIMNVDAFNDPRRQFACMETAAARGLAPKVHFSNADNAIFITSFIESKPLADCFDDRLDFLNCLVEKIKDLHSLPLFPELINFIEGVEIFKSLFQELQMFPPELTDECFRLYSQIPRLYKSDVNDIVSSHNDLNPNNLLYDGQSLWIIDWETAFQNDKYVDLAIIAQFFAQDENEDEIILKSYFGSNLNDCKRARFYIMQQVCYMYYAMISLRMAAEKQNKGFTHNCEMKSLPSLKEFKVKVAKKKVSMTTYDGQLTYGKILLKIILENLQNKTFANALKVIPG